MTGNFLCHRVPAEVSYCSIDLCSSDSSTCSANSSPQIHQIIFHSLRAICSPRVLNLKPPVKPIQSSAHFPVAPAGVPRGFPHPRGTSQGSNPSLRCPRRSPRGSPGSPLPSTRPLASPPRSRGVDPSRESLLRRRGGARHVGVGQPLGLTQSDCKVPCSSLHHLAGVCKTESNHATTIQAAERNAGNHWESRMMQFHAISLKNS